MRDTLFINYSTDAFSTIFINWCYLVISLPITIPQNTMMGNIFNINLNLLTRIIDMSWFLFWLRISFSGWGLRRNQTFLHICFTQWVVATLIAVSLTWHINFSQAFMTISLLLLFNQQQFFRCMLIRMGMGVSTFISDAVTCPIKAISPPFNVLATLIIFSCDCWIIIMFYRKFNYFLSVTHLFSYS